MNPEYIVVGSGAGGGPLAARLAELGHRVLLLEAGGDDEPWTYQVPVLHALATEDEAMRLDHYVRHYPDEDRQSRDPNYEPARGGVFYPRARTLGGCTAHYAMIIIRPHDSDWQAIRDATGDASWSPEAMNKYFARVERCLYRWGAEGGHGKDGWLPIAFPDRSSLLRALARRRDVVISQIALEAQAAATLGLINAPERCGFLPGILGFLPFFWAWHDPNDLRVLEQRKTGCFWSVPSAIDEKGRRAGTRERIRAAQRTGFLDVRLHSHATELVFDPNDRQRVVGVRYLRGVRLHRADRSPARSGIPSGPPIEVRADREVILSAGALLTPQLLMLSGIGPKAELELHGIRVRKDLPGVGANLQDRYEVGIATRRRPQGEEFNLLKKAAFQGPSPGEAGDGFFRTWRRKGKGLYATNGAVQSFIVRSVVAENHEPDLFVFGVPGAFVGYRTGWSSAAVAKPHDKWTWLVLKAHTRYSGWVKLRSKDPLDPPDVNFDYFPRDEATGALKPDAAADLAAMREGVRFVNRLIEGSREVLELHPTLMQGVDLVTDAGIDAFVQDHAWGHHASCTCKIGGDGDRHAVLDSSFRVRGVSGLRVVDASVFPRIPGFFVVMPTYMISEKAADVIHAQAQASS